MLASVLCFVHAPALYPLVAQEGSGILRPETGSEARRGAPRGSPSSRRAIESPTAHQRCEGAPAGSASFQSVFVAPEIPNGRLESLARRASSWPAPRTQRGGVGTTGDRKSTRLNSSHLG